MTTHAAVGKEKAVRDLCRAGRPRGRSADRPRVGSLPPPNRYLRKSVDSGNQKLTFCRFQPDDSFPVNRAVAASFVDGGDDVIERCGSVHRFVPIGQFRAAL
jgi:hypothetical protein